MKEIDTQLQMGKKVESEHRGTYDFLVECVNKEQELPSADEFFELIAADHLKEFPDYYTRLKKMEAMK